MEEYKRLVRKVLDFLDKNGYGNSIIKSNISCYHQLEEHIREKGGRYSPQEADEWLASISMELSRSYRSYYAAALLRLSDVYELGEIHPRHQTKKLMSYTALNDYWKSVLDEYTLWMGKIFAQATADNHRHMCARFLVYLQRSDVHNISDITYGVVCRFHEEDIHYGRWGKNHVNGCVTAFFSYLHGKGGISYGFTVLLHYITFEKRSYWNAVSDGAHARIRKLMETEETCPASCLHKYQLAAEDVYIAERYAKSIVSAFRRAADLLFLFLDINQYTYSPAIAEVWFQDVRCLCSKEAPTIRRGLCLIAEYHGSSRITLTTVFREKKRAFSLLPEWCRETADRYEADKIKEGWALSTLNMIRSSICRFCNYLDAIGIRDFKVLNATHIKQFNRNDIHKTPAGKNAYNVRIRHFLFFLGTNGYIGNSFLFIALTKTAAPRENIVVVLTAEEKENLMEELRNEASLLSLRKKAMLLMGLRMGMRSSDIVNLKFSDIDWDGASIRFVQEKTGVEVNLPLPNDVGNALFRYITQERVSKAHPDVFLGEKASHSPVGRSICRKALDTALPDRDVPGSGFHVTRRTYATDLLRKGIGIAQVAEALGQRGTNSVHKYLALDEDRMRMCALSLGECGIGRFVYGR